MAGFYLKLLAQVFKWFLICLQLWLQKDSLGWVICWTKPPAPSVLKGRKGTNQYEQINMNLILRDVKAPLRCPSRPASCYCFDPAPARIQPRTAPAPALASVNLTTDTAQPTLLTDTGQARHKGVQDRQLGQGLHTQTSPWGSVGNNTKPTA